MAFPVGEIMEFLTPFLNWTTLFGFIGGTCYILTFLMQTIVPLRIAGIASNFFLMFFGFLSGSLISGFLYLVLVPINSVRLYQILQLIKKVRTASQGDLSMDWLKPFMTKRAYKAGDVLFNKGDPAEEMFYTVDGKFLITALKLELQPGQIVGEMGLLAPDGRRTQTVECIADGAVLGITYDKVRELYFQNPDFGFYFLRLTSQRMLQNIARLEATVASLRAAQTAPGKPVA